jgi:non-ribosomal peptide synthetase component E (peptide arylation enzyme)
VSLADDGEWVPSALIEDRTERLPERVAFEAGGTQLAYGELRDRTARAAGAKLREAGVTADTVDRERTRVEVLRL